MTSNELIRNELRGYIQKVGVDHIMKEPTPQELEMFEGLLYIRGIPNMSFIDFLIH